MCYALFSKPGCVFFCSFVEQNVVSIMEKGKKSLCSLYINNKNGTQNFYDQRPLINFSAFSIQYIEIFVFNGPGFDGDIFFCVRVRKLYRKFCKIWQKAHCIL